MLALVVLLAVQAQTVLATFRRFEPGLTARTLGLMAALHVHLKRARVHAPKAQWAGLRVGRGQVLAVEVGHAGGPGCEGLPAVLLGAGAGVVRPQGRRWPCSRGRLLGFGGLG